MQIEFMQIELSNILILIRQLIQLVSSAYPDMQLLKAAYKDSLSSDERRNEQMRIIAACHVLRHYYARAEEICRSDLGAEQGDLMWITLFGTYQKIATTYNTFCSFLCYWVFKHSFWCFGWRDVYHPNVYKGDCGAHKDVMLHVCDIKCKFILADNRHRLTKNRNSVCCHDLSIDYVCCFANHPQDSGQREWKQLAEESYVESKRHIEAYNRRVWKFAYFFLALDCSIPVVHALARRAISFVL